jgi:hypothetical protein
MLLRASRALCEAPYRACAGDGKVLVHGQGNRELAGCSLKSCDAARRLPNSVSGRPRFCQRMGLAEAR